MAAGRLRIWFTRDDLHRLRVADRPSPMWELTMSLQRIQSRRPDGRPTPPIPADIATWRADVLAGADRSALRAAREVLLPLAPVSSYFPDFLTPHAGLYGLEEGIDAACATPRRQLAAQLATLAARSGPPAWGVYLPRHRTSDLHRLERALRRWFHAALAPRWPELRRRVAAEHALLARAGAKHGPDGVLSGLRPFSVWHPTERFLEAPYPMDRDLRLAGRGLTIVPSWFCCTAPVTLAGDDQPPVLVHPIGHQPPPPTGLDPLARLIGRTRAELLAAVTVATPAPELCARTGVSRAQVSRHLAALRDNHLVTETHRHGRTYYTRTELGDRLADGH
ncbi:winged helix-turn-helix domain-containing protein [Actinocatenispora rupis]|uniref:Transcriptional regulator n=1 Tax=Actinocatenispora rupis TaxID=519421 RepID=A0A8J3J7G0_9ACTN|nr:winged helix-turn-helix domain-containing protein [Actinocatenispora rupis]GID11484.1 transcriptional regulator [Actinocatenispora rupis]